MTDMIYLGNDSSRDLFFKEYQASFPDVKFISGWDDVHENRVMIELTEDILESHVKWIIKNGWSGTSFWIQMAIPLVDSINKKSHESLVKWVNEIKKEREGLI